MMSYPLYLLAWASFGLLHSWLARPATQDRLTPWLGAAYRLSYNALALVHFLAVLTVGWLLLEREPFAVPSVLSAFLVVMVCLGTGLLGVSLCSYGLMRFLVDGRRGSEPGVLQTAGPNRYVRHPTYLGALLIFWGLAGSPLGVTTALCATAYILLAIPWEERDLERQYGADYRAYRQRVPMLLPWRGKAGG